MRGAADHLTKNQPVRIECCVPLQRAARFVPKFDPLEEFAEPGDKYVEEISVLLRIARRRTLAGGNAKAWRRIMKTREQV